jgi:CO/xanthine dehydrogenase FAD-binding subunit
MNSYLPAYEMKAPRDLAEALALLAEDPGGWQPFAGGTDLMVLLELGKLVQRRFLSLWRLRELRGIEAGSEHVTLGALTTYTAVQAAPALARDFPMLCRAAAETGGIATQNRGTLAGNIANASPAADSPPALLCYDAELELISARGARWVPYHGFHTGYKKMLLRPDELIGRIRLPRSRSAARGWRQYYRKVGTRRVQAISKVCFAGAAEAVGGKIRDIRIALGSVAPTAVRATRTEELLRGERLTAAAIAAAQRALEAEVAPIDDFRSTAVYRRRVARNLLAEFLASLADGSSGPAGSGR